MCACARVHMRSCLRMYRRPRERVEERTERLIDLEGHMCACACTCARTELLIDLEGRPRHAQDRAQDPIAETNASRTSTGAPYRHGAIDGRPRIGQKAAAQLCKDRRLTVVNTGVNEQMGGRHPPGPCEQGVEARSPRIPVSEYARA